MSEPLYRYHFGSDSNSLTRYRLRWKGRVCRV